MSHAQAVIRFDDGEFWFAEYDGTMDRLVSKIYPSLAECRAEWREAALDFAECTCSPVTTEHAVYAERYGGAGHGDVTACRRCKVLTDCSAFYTDDMGCAFSPHDGLPDWWDLAFA